MNLDKKTNELLCLERVIKEKKYLRGESREIVNKISGREFDREAAERPDFVRYCPPASEHEKGTLIGIEHFRVDRLSLQKNDGKVASTGIRTEKEVHKIFEQWREKVTTSEEVPEGAISAIADLIAAQMERQDKSSYYTFLRSFEYSLKKHLENVDVYRENLLKLSEKEYYTELALLIEVHSEFRNLFLNNQKGTYREKNNFTPLFEDMVRLMEESIDCNKVDYIIFCMGGTLYTNKLKIIAIRTADIRKRLRKQNVDIYEYAGEDLLYADFSVTQRNVKDKPGYKIEGDKISFVIEHTDEELNEQLVLDAICYSLKRALEYQKARKNFVTTYGTQMMLEVFGKYVTGWKKDRIRPILKSDAGTNFIYKMKTFDKKYKVHSGGN